MTRDDAAMADFYTERRRLERILARALRSRGNPLILAGCAAQLGLQVVERRARELVDGDVIVTDVDRGRALWGLLREAIERLRPVDTEPKATPAWRLHAIAEGVYVEGKLARQVAAELDVSPRTFNRERRAAVEALATVVWQTEQEVVMRYA